MERMNNDAERKAETSAERYAYHMTEVFDKLDALKAYLTYHSVDAQKADWSHVGSAAHISKLLDEVAEFIGVGHEE